MKFYLFVQLAFVLLVTELSAGPNILLLFTDDQRADTIGALGNPHIITPHLDRLAKRGLAFNNAYCFGSDVPAVCTPSRNMFLSGRVYSRWKGLNAPATPHTLPAVMKAAGYETYHHGKKWNTAPLIQAQFDHDKYLKNDEAERRSGEPGKIIVEEAIEFLKNRKSERPFLMYLAFGNPHDPRVAASHFRAKYRGKTIPTAPNFLPTHPFDNGELAARDEKLAPSPRTEKDISDQLLDYYATITALDFEIGRLLETLQALNLEKETLIVFSSDQGLAMGSHGLMGKQNLYEHSMKVPLVFAGPNIKAGQTEALVYLMDLFPTLASLVGANEPPDLDGRSFLPVLQGKKKDFRETIFCAYRDVQRSVRNERWKIIQYPKIGRTQLFDLKNDPHELRDLAGKEPRLLRSMMGTLGKLEAEFNLQK